MTANLRTRAVRGVIWNGINQVVVQAIQLVVGIFLARLLLPAEFGLVAMLMVFMAVAQTFVDSGFGSALIQRQALATSDASTVFYFNLLVAVAMTVLFYAAAPAMAHFYQEPALVPLTRVLALNLVINAFGLVQSNLLTKSLDFREQTIVAIAGAAVGGVVGIGMALTDYGVWSLVGQSLATNGVRSGLLWFVTDWRPTLVFSMKALREMLTFGSRLLASSLISTIADSTYSLVIGKLFSATQLGYYSQARRLQGFPVGGLMMILSRVTFPAFSEIQNDHDRLRRALHRCLTLTVFVVFPLMVALAVCARPLVALILTDKWLPAVPYMQLLCLVSMTVPLNSINLYFLMSKGRADLFLKLEIFKQILILTGIALSWPFGVSGLIWSQVVVCIIGFYLNSYYTDGIIGYSFWAQTRDIAPYLAASAAMAIAMNIVALPFDDDGVTTLVCQLATGACVYLATCASFGLSAVKELMSLIRDKAMRRTMTYGSDDRQEYAPLEDSQVAVVHVPSRKSS